MCMGGAVGLLVKGQFPQILDPLKRGSGLRLRGFGVDIAPVYS